MIRSCPSPVPGGDHVGVGAVGRPGQAGVEVVAGHAVGDDQVRGTAPDAGFADGHALYGGVGVGVAEPDVALLDVPGGDGAGDAAAGFGGGDRPVVADVGHGPAVVVADEVGAAQGQNPLVPFGDDDVAGGDLVAVGQCQRRAGDLPGGDPAGAGFGVELGDEFEGGADHDGVGAVGDVGCPGGVDLVGDGGGGGGVQLAPVDVQAGDRRVPFPQGEGRGAQLRVGEPHDFGQREGAVRGFDVAEHPAGAVGGALLVIAEQDDAAAAAGDEPDGGVQLRGGGDAGFVDDDEGVGADGLHPRLPLILRDGGEVVGEFVECVGVDAGDGGGEFLCGGGLRRQPEDGAAGGLPPGGEDSHDGGFPGAGGCQREHQRSVGGGDVADHRGLRGVEPAALVVGRPFQRGDLHIAGGDGAGTRLAGVGDKSLLGRQDRGGGVQLVPGDPEHRGAVAPLQLRRHRDAHFGVHADGDGVVQAGGPVSDDPRQVDHPLRVDPGSADLPQRFGMQVGLPPMRAAVGHGGDGLIGQLRQQAGGHRGGFGVDAESGDHLF